MYQADTSYILAVDDTPSSLKLLTDLLSAEGYKVRPAINGELALRAATAQTPELILLDANMPGMDGFEVCRRMKQEPKLSEVPVIFVSALSEMPEKLRGFEFGAVDYVTKPYQRKELLARVRTHLELHRLRNYLEEMVEQRTRSLRQSEERLQKTLLESVSAMSTIIELRDPYTAGHQQRVARIAEAIAHELRLPEKMIQGIRLAAVLHDIGKISVPTEILIKPSRLNDSELALIRQHATYGYNVLKEIDFPWPIAKTVRQHHERLNGSGYPDGLRGEEIMLEARILGVSDVIEAMASHRPYRAGLGMDAALAEIEKNRGVLYDPVVADTALRMFREHLFVLEA